MEEILCEKVWNEKIADVSWTIVSFARRALGVPISPCIATSFVYLHNYFANNKTTKYPLRIILSASLFLSCKTCEMYRNIDQIYLELSKTACALTKHIPRKFIELYLGTDIFVRNVLTDEEKEMLFPIEVKLLDSVNWSFSFELPFDHMTLHGNLFNGLPLTEAEIDAVSQQMLRNLCLMMRTPRYIVLDKEIIAAASIESAFSTILAEKGLSLDDSISFWIEKTREKNKEEFGAITKYVVAKSQKVC